MKMVRDALNARGTEVYSVSPTQTVFSAAEYMTEKNVGAVAVVEGKRLLGVLSERDIMTKVVSLGLNSHVVAVGEVMSIDLVLASPDDSCEECSVRMKAASCRHLPVTEEGQFLGMISLRDLLGTDLEEKEEKVELLDQYIWNLPRKEV